MDQIDDVPSAAEGLPPLAPVVVQALAAPVDPAQNRALRPTRLADFTGQAQVRHNLQLTIEAARGRGQPVDHILFTGPAGLGKTTLAHVVAAEMGATCIETAAPSFSKPGDLAGVLCGLKPHSVLFIDEIHSLKREIEEYLYSAMESYRITVQLGSASATQHLGMALPPFTLIGATTRAGLITKAFRSRFIINERLDLYQLDEIVQVLQRSAAHLQMRYTDEALRLVAARARGTPRIANHLLRRTRDVADVQNQGLVDLGVAQRALEMLGLDEAGLSDMDRRILACLARAGRPTGLKTVATLVGEEESTIETAYEPWLLQLGFLIRLPAGRAITERGRDHIRAGGVVLAGDRWESAPDLFSEDLT